MLRDFRFAARSLSRSPLLTVLVAGTLALGIAANATFFGVIDAVLLRPLTYSEPERLVQVHETVPRLGRMPAGGSEFEQWKMSARSFERLALLAVAPVIVTGGEAQRLEGGRASASLFPMLGVRAALGRTFREDEAVPGHDGVAVLSDALWRSRYAADPQIIGRTIVLNDRPHEVVGVLPADFHFPRLDRLFVMGISGDRPQIWTPLAITDVERGENSYAALGQLKRGVTIAQAATEATLILEQFARTLPDAPTVTADVVPLQQQITGEARDTLALLWAAVLTVLIVACANIANILLARSSRQRAALAVRGALGASRWQLLRHTLTEGMLLAGIGGIAGVLLSWWAIPLVVRLIPESVPRLDEVALDWRGVLFASAITVIAGLTIGGVPAVNAVRTALIDALRAAGRRESDGRRETVLRRMMLGMQVALTVVCLATTGLVVQSLANVLKVDRGFSGANTYGIDVSLSPGRYASSDARVSFASRTLTALQAAPGVTDVAFTNKPPMTGASMGSVVALEGTENAPIPVLERPLADVRSVDPRYFETMGIPMLQGRTFDDASGTLSAIVSQQMAKRAWPGQNPIGRRFRLSSQPNRLVEVIGVAGNVHNLGPEAEQTATIYLPYRQMFLNGSTFLVKTTLAPETLASVVHSAIRGIDSEVPIDRIRPIDSIVTDATAGRRFDATILVLFAGTAVILVTMGIFGVVAYGITQRSREFGIRLALGASPRGIGRMLFGQIVATVVLGLAAGVPLAIVAGYGLRSVLFGISPGSPAILAMTSLFLLLVSGVGTWIPARRVSAIDPAETLRA